jgi:hypothetical protein
MNNKAITTDWNVLHKFYKGIMQQIEDRGINGLTTGGIACVLYELASSTKDCDIIIPEEHADDIVNILTKSEIDGQRFHLTLKYGAPLHTRWLQGGWSSHTFVGDVKNGTEQALARLDFFARPPRVPIKIADAENPQYLSRDGVARMKKTRRERDWAFANFLGQQMVERRESQGILHITNPQKLLEVCKNAEIETALIYERPILQLAIDGHPDLERYIKAEKEFFAKLDNARLLTYETAWIPYGKELHKEAANLLAMDLETQNQAMIEIAKQELEPTPINASVWDDLINQAKEQTGQIFQNIDLDLLPTPILFAKENGLGH